MHPPAGVLDPLSRVTARQMTDQRRRRAERALACIELLSCICYDALNQRYDYTKSYLMESPLSVLLVSRGAAQKPVAEKYLSKGV